MNNKAFTISLALAAMAVFMIYSYVTSRETELQNKYGDKLPVLVAKKTIRELDEIRPNMFETMEIPRQFREPGFLTNLKDLEGMIAMVTIAKGEQITLNKIVAPSIRTGLSKQITPGKRAISVPVDDNTAVTRLIKPGDRVDIMATIDPPGGGKGSSMTKIVAQDIPVIAVGEYVSGTAPRKVETDEISNKQTVRNLNVEHNYNTITLETDPQIAATLSLLRDSAQKVSIMLRNNEDTERVNIPAMTLLDVLGPDTSRIIRAPSAQQK